MKIFHPQSSGACRMKLLACLLLFALWLVPTAVFSQSTSATISGGVTDPTGQFITGAAVEVANDETGVRYSVQTNGSGMYFVPILPPGHYHVQVSKQGFKTIIKSDVVLNVQGAIALNFVLPVGATSQSITIEAGSSLLNTTDAAVSTVIDQKFVENIPLNGRSFQDLISMTPGVVSNSPQAGGGTGFNGDFSINGQRSESNYYTIDGVSANTSAGNNLGTQSAASSGSVPGASALGTTQSLLSVDALQEFRVQSSTYSAEYGRSPGGQLSFVTRSGSNEFHGVAFDYLRNDYFDANDWFNGLYSRPQSALRQNDFGGTIGGPVLLPGFYNGRGRSFFFASYEGLRLTQPQPAAVQYVPDRDLRQDAPAGLQSILNAYPLPNGREEMIACTVGVTSPYPCPAGSPTGTLVQSGLADFIQPYSVPSSIDSTSVRLDHTFGSKLALFFRFGDTPSFADSRSFSSVTKANRNTQTYTLGATSQVSARIVNEVRIGYARTDAIRKSALDSFSGAIPTDLNSSFGVAGYAHPNPLFLISFSGIGTSLLSVYDSGSKGRQWNFVDNLSLSSGGHHFRLGVDYRRIKSVSIRSTPSVSAVLLNKTAVLTNATSTTVGQYISATPIFNQAALYAQDEWRPKPAISLSFGLRWELAPPPTESNGNDAYTLRGDIGNPSSLSLAPRGTPLWDTSWFNFAPRVGAAWTPHNRERWETVVRVGGGVFFDTNGQIASLGFGGVGFSATKSYSSAALPMTPAQLNFSPSVTPPYTSSVVYAFPRRLQLPYTLQWNVSLGQKLGKSQALTVSYVGSNGRRLSGAQQLSLNSLNSNFGTIIFPPSGLTSEYQALQLQFQRSVKHGVQALASYTWSHSIDFGSTYSALQYVRGNSDFDVRHNFSGGLSWDIPEIRSDKIVNTFLNHWGLDGRLMARTGFPVTLSGNLLIDPATGNQFYGGVNLVPNQPIYLFGAQCINLPGSQCPGGRVINRAAFTAATGTTVGNAPRNFVRGFGEFQINSAIRRQFILNERLSLLFRAEAFNILNHPNFGLITSSLTSATFGQATSMLNSSLTTAASQYQQGGPRSMQFALKVLF